MERSSRRPVALIGRSDLVVSRIFYRGDEHFVIKDPVGLRYHRLRGVQLRLLESLDGRTSLETLRDRLRKEYPTHRFTLRELQQLAAELHQKGLAYSDRPGQSETRLTQDREQRSRQLWQGLMSLLSLRLPGWDPDAALVMLLPWFRWMFHPLGIAACLAFVLSSWVTLAIHWQEYRQTLPGYEQFFGWPNLIYLWLMLAGAKILHEFGHGLSCRYYGSECHQMGVMLLVFSPCLYCDVSDSWMLRNKWQRIFIGGAGMYVELILSAIAIYFWQATSAGLLHYLALNLLFVTAVTTIIFNANPLIRLDGYYMLSDWLEVPNLRPQADKFLRDAFGKICLGIEPQRDPFAPETGRVWFVLFAIASQIYGWLVLGGILLFLYSVLKPWDLQSLGQALAWFSIGGIVGGILMNVYQIVSAPRTKPINRFRLGVTLALLAGFALAAFQFPVPWYRSAPFLIEPENVRHVVTKAAGQLDEIHVQPGQFVDEGQLLATLSDPEWESRLEDLQLRIKVQAADAELYGALDDLPSRAVALEGLAALRAEEREIESHLSQLVIHAPCSGIVVGPQPQRKSMLEQQEARLPTWESTPLNPRNQGAFLPERTMLLSIAPAVAPDDAKRFEAVVYLDQADLHDVRERMGLRLKLEHQPWRVLTGHIRHIGPAETDTVPPPLTNKQGGPLSTVTDQTGNERVADATYQAVVEFEDPPNDLQTGLRGQARILIMQRTLGDWMWRWFRRTFDFEI